MRRGKRFATGLRAVSIAIGASLVMSAQAQYDLGVWHFVFVSESPGSQGGSDWSINSGTFNGYAGGLNWTLTQGIQSKPLASLCSSFQQDFDPGGAPFDAHGYWLLGSTATANGIILGDGFTSVGLPAVDVPPATGTTFLRAAAIFGEFHNSAFTNSLDATALQLAVWQTLYAPSPAFIPNFTGSAPAQLVADEAAYYNAGQALNSSNWSGYLSNVDWYNYTGSELVNGQGQFQYHPSATPEPFTIALGIIGLAVAARRRLSKPKI